MITVVGYPRSGTNFLHRMLAHYVDGPDTPPWSGMGAHPQVRKIHWAYQRQPGEREVYIYRDPRDCALSGYEYVKRGFAPGLELDTFLETHFSGKWALWPSGWREHVCYWLGQGIPAAPYEVLCRDRSGQLGEIVAALGLDVENERLAWAVEQSYRYGEYRKDDRYVGRIGRWVQEIDAEALRWIDAYCGPLIDALDYEGVKDE